jgi:hypothetical protein
LNAPALFPSGYIYSDAPTVVRELAKPPKIYGTVFAQTPIKLFSGKKTSNFSQV